MTENDGQAGGRADGQELPDAILAAARQINDPPSTPRDEIWSRVQAARADRSVRPSARPSVIQLPVRPSARRPLLAWAAGIAAILLLGIALGRSTVTTSPVPGPSTISALPDSSLPREKKNTAYTVAAVQHLTRVETFLTTLRTSPEQQFTGQGRELLISTRLLLDAKDMDPRLRKLMSDLEDILVQIVQYNANGTREDLDLITDGLEERQVLPRLHSAIPAGPARAL
ncbi:MAG TPA: hypothetical protein VJU15_01620 [Gemmatimonadales bacterium]|nr:hypothetical protein [Gemmatimonadales bacterium]